MAAADRRADLGCMSYINTDFVLQVYEVATNAGAGDIVPALDEDEHLEGYKVDLHQLVILLPVKQNALCHMAMWCM